MLKRIFILIFISSIFIFTYKLLAENSVKYLPMNISRFWEYKIEVPKDGNYLSLRRMLLNDSLIYNTQGQNPIKKGTYALHYVVKEKTKDPDIWEIRIAKDTLKLYSNVEKIFWEFEKTEKNIVTITERLIYTREFAMKYCPMSGSTPTVKAESSNLIFFEQPEYSNYAIGSGDVKYTYLSRGNKLNVPTGMFSNCIIMAEDVKPSDKPDKNFPPSFGWVTLSTWAPNIGLIEKTQLNANKEIIWKISLINYGIK